MFTVTAYLPTLSGLSSLPLYSTVIAPMPVYALFSATGSSCGKPSYTTTLSRAKMRWSAASGAAFAMRWLLSV